MSAESRLYVTFNYLKIIATPIGRSVRCCERLCATRGLATSRNDVKSIVSRLRPFLVDMRVGCEATLAGSGPSTTCCEPSVSVWSASDAVSGAIPCALLCCYGCNITGCCSN